MKFLIKLSAFILCISLGGCTYVTDESIDENNSTDNYTASTEFSSTEEVETSVETIIAETSESSIIRDTDSIAAIWNNRPKFDENIDVDCVKIVNVVQSANTISVSEDLPALKTAVESILEENTAVDASFLSNYVITRFDNNVLSFYHVGCHDDTGKLTVKCYNLDLDGNIIKLSDVISDLDLFYDILDLDDSGMIGNRIKNSKCWVFDTNSIAFLNPAYERNEAVDACYIPYEKFADIIDVKYLPGIGTIIGNTGYGEVQCGEDSIVIDAENVHSLKHVFINDNELDYLSEFRANGLLGDIDPEYVDISIDYSQNGLLILIYQVSSYDGDDNPNGWLLYEIKDGAVNQVQSGKGRFLSE